MISYQSRLVPYRATCNVELNGDICMQFQAYMKIFENPLYTLYSGNCWNFENLYLVTPGRFETENKYHHSTQDCKLLL
jgi:hypothetical protein